MSTYLHTIISFCQGARVWQTDGRTDRQMSIAKCDLTKLDAHKNGAIDEATKFTYLRSLISTVGGSDWSTGKTGKRYVSFPGCGQTVEVQGSWNGNESKDFQFRWEGSITDYAHLSPGQLRKGRWPGYKLLST